MTRRPVSPWFIRFAPVFEIGCGAVLLIWLAFLILTFFAALGDYP